MQNFSKKNLKIYQVFHRPYPRNTECNWIQPLGVGGYSDIGFINDNTGVNISEKNPQYSELTGQYWMWKNTQEDYVGLCHYRRMFNFLQDDYRDQGTPVQSSPTIIPYLTSSTQRERIDHILGVYDAIITKDYDLGMPISTQYLAYCENMPWHLFKQILSLKYPNAGDALNYFDVQVYAPMCCMFVMRRDLFNAYCNDLFQVMDLCHKHFGAPFSPWNNRYPAFIGERFYGFWFHINRIPTYRAQVHQINLE